MGQINSSLINKKAMHFIIITANINNKYALRCYFLEFIDSDDNINTLDKLKTHFANKSSSSYPDVDVMLGSAIYYDNVTKPIMDVIYDRNANGILFLTFNSGGQELIYESSMANIEVSDKKLGYAVQSN